MSKRVKTSRKTVVKKKVVKKQGTACVKYCFTVNNPDDVNAPLALKDVKYLRWQYEVGENGTPHLQGFLWLARKKRMTALQKEMKGHYEMAMGTPAQNYAYCGKCCDDYKLAGHLCKEQRLLGTFYLFVLTFFNVSHFRVSLGPWEIGILPKGNGEVALLTMDKMLQEGKTLLQIKNAFPAAYMRHYRALEHVRFLINNQDKPRGEPTIVWLWGDSGKGKTKFVKETFPEAFWKPKNKWWDGYEYQDCVVFDEFYGWIEFDQILRLLDWYPLKTELKGSHVQIKATTFVFTSNECPTTLYRHIPWVRRSAFFRRLIEFGTVLRFRDDEVTNYNKDLKDYYTTFNLNPTLHDQGIFTSAKKHKHSFHPFFK